MRQANKAVQGERFPIPNVEDTLYQMNGATVFSKLDLTQSFHQIELEESSRYITTYNVSSRFGIGKCSLCTALFACRISTYKRTFPEGLGTTTNGLHEGMNKI
jgi:predicted GTPase